MGRGRQRCRLPEHGPSTPRGAGVLAVLGLLFVAVAVWAAGAGVPAAVPAQRAPVSLASAIDVPTFRTHEPDALLPTPSSYAPGQSSGWHRHPGLHLVTIVSGTLTAYDRDCTAATYGPGQSYLGGDEPHLARNENEVTLEMAVTYLPAGWPVPGRVPGRRGPARLVPCGLTAARRRGGQVGRLPTGLRSPPLSIATEPRGTSTERKQICQRRHSRSPRFSPGLPTMAAG